jgi:Mg-chelatase subunit ChlD
LTAVSPEVGKLDDQAVASAFAADPDETMTLLADMARATDRRLREQARSLATRLLLAPARRGNAGGSSGAVRLATGRRLGLDLDVDATLDGLAGRPPAGDELRWRAWQRPGRAYVLVVDASGSVAGRPLTTAVVTAAALAGRLQDRDELAAVAFWSRAVVLRPIGGTDPPARVIDALFDLRGGDTTDLAAGIRAGLAEVARATARRRDIIVLTDGLATAGDDPVAVAAGAAAQGAAVHVLALSGEAEAMSACQTLVSAGGGRVARLDRPSDAGDALHRVLERV